MSANNFRRTLVNFKLGTVKLAKWRHSMQGWLTGITGNWAKPAAQPTFDASLIRRRTDTFTVPSCIFSLSLLQVRRVWLFWLHNSFGIQQARVSKNTEFWSQARMFWTSGNPLIVCILVKLQREADQFVPLLKVSRLVTADRQTKLTELSPGSQLGVEHRSWAALSCLASCQIGLLHTFRIDLIFSKKIDVQS